MSESTEQLDDSVYAIELVKQHEMLLNVVAKLENNEKLIETQLENLTKGDSARYSKNISAIVRLSEQLTSIQNSKISAIKALADFEKATKVQRLNVLKVKVAEKANSNQETINSKLLDYLIENISGTSADLFSTPSNKEENMEKIEIYCSENGQVFLIDEEDNVQFLGYEVEKIFTGKDIKEGEEPYGLLSDGRKIPLIYLEEE